MKTIFPFLIALIFVFISCRKKGEVTGRVTNYFDKTPVEGIHLMIGYTNGSFFNYKSGEIGPAVTDANGEFKIDTRYKRSKRMEYSIGIRMPDTGLEMDTLSETSVRYSSWYKPFQNQAFYHLDKSESQHCEFYVVPQARLRVKIKDVPPTTTDYIEVFIEDPATESPQIYNSEFGTDSTAGYYKYVVPVNNQVRIKYSLSGSSGTLWETKTIQLSPFKKTTFLLEY
jgi:hypothetical protein